MSLKRVLTNTALIAALSVIAKAMIVVKDIYQVRLYGLSDALDSYIMAYLLPQLLMNVVAASFATSFLPIFIKWRRADQSKAERLVQEASFILLLLLMACSLLFYLMAPLIMPLLASGFSSEKKETVLWLMGWLIPTLIGSGMATFYGYALNACHRYAQAAILPTVTPLVIFIGLLLFQRDIKFLAYFTLLGTLIEWGLTASLFRQGQWSVLPRWHGFLAESKQILAQYWPMIAGALVMSGTAVVDQSMAAMKSMPAGSVSALAYGMKLCGLFIAVGGTALTSAIFPQFAEQVQSQSWRALKKLLLGVSVFVLLSCIPLLASLVWFSQDIVRLLYQGDAFAVDDTPLVATLQAIYVLQLPFYFLWVIYVRAASALQKNQIILRVASFNFITNIVANWVLVQWMGLSGIATATVVVYFLSALITAIYLYQHLGKVERAPSLCTQVRV